jgi:hypothetical protein
MCNFPTPNGTNPGTTTTVTNATGPVKDKVQRPRFLGAGPSAVAPPRPVELRMCGLGV